ncbi:hypothetical protein PybrP1_002896 [[Pythium] brassicae (nom. inval.)]|nr:hypothetical protein PybrP1_002896 [[Pythium] brassicae (nom. inval.)]
MWYLRRGPRRSDASNALLKHGLRRGCRRTAMRSRLVCAGRRLRGQSNRATSTTSEGIFIVSLFTPPSLIPTIRTFIAQEDERGIPPLVILANGFTDRQSPNRSKADRHSVCSPPGSRVFGSSPSVRETRSRAADNDMNSRSCFRRAPTAPVNLSSAVATKMTHSLSA